MNMQNILETTQNVQSVLTWLIYSGGAILVASWVLDRIPAYVALLPEAKKYINMAVSVILALAAFACITYVPAAVFAQLDPWFKIVAGVVVLYSAQQTVHALTK
jgi:hypothetical protein